MKYSGSGCDLSVRCAGTRMCGASSSFCRAAVDSSEYLPELSRDKMPLSARKYFKAGLTRSWFLVISVSRVACPPPATLAELNCSPRSSSSAWRRALEKGFRPEKRLESDDSLVSAIPVKATGDIEWDRINLREMIWWKFSLKWDGKKVRDERRAKFWSTAPRYARVILLRILLSPRVQYH